jgi:serine phosphatase RsbU (regulator of sigma subunit)
MQLSCGQASRALAGQSCIGDLAWWSREGDRAVVAVIDGLGHGHEAEAAAIACQAALELGQGENIGMKFARCHESLKHTRGAAVSMASIDFAKGRLSWAGVGNVEGLFLHGLARERLLLKSGIVGYTLPELRVSELSAASGDLLIFVTDGILPDFSRNFDACLDAQALAWSILNSHSRGNDDALVWVGRLHE